MKKKVLISAIVSGMIVLGTAVAAWAPTWVCINGRWYRIGEALYDSAIKFIC